MYDIIFIGGGPTGIMGNFIANHWGFKTAIVEADNYLGGQPMSLYSEKHLHDIPGYKDIIASDLTKIYIEQMEQYKEKYDIFLNVRVISFEKTEYGFSVMLENKKELKSKFIVITTGIGQFIHRPLEISKQAKDYDEKKIEYNLKSNDHYKNKNVVIFGGGDSAVDIANHVAQYCFAKNVAIVHRRDTFRAAGLSVANLAKNNVDQYMDVTIESISNHDIILVSNESHHKSTLEYDIAIVQYGQTINPKSLSQFTTLEKKANRIIVDENNESSTIGVYAAGNIVFKKLRPNLICIGVAEVTTAVWAIRQKIIKYE